MKKALLSAALCSALLTLAFCKSKKTTAAAPALSPAEIMGRQLAVAERRWPGATAGEIEEGKKIYTTRCNTCHGNFEITKFNEKKWLHEIDEMAPKAKLNDLEKQQLTKHILSYREAFGGTGS